MMTLLSSVDLSRFSKRIYVISKTDKISESKVNEFESSSLVCYNFF